MWMCRRKCGSYLTARQEQPLFETAHGAAGSPLSVEENIHIPRCLFLCNAMYYCCSISSSDLVDRGADGKEFFLRGQELFEEKYLRTHICIIQGLLLFANGNRTTVQSSKLTYQAVTMALTIGCHTKQDEGINSIMKAYPARVFCFIYDSTLSAIGGESVLISDEGITVDMFEADDLDSEEETCSDQCMLHYVRGWRIYREIQNYCSDIVQGPQYSEQFLFNHLEQLEKSLVEWQEQLLAVLNVLPTRESITSPIKATAASARLLCYSLIIFLHYPYLPDPDSSYTPSTVEQSCPPDSQRHCTQATNEITRVTSILLEKAS
ncbi:hypothetical protein BG015_005542 [Linnemannia schmuckeri]|uniref:Xylanolytic transcriptional activator regulatory domain-containing protein n=1 Tax=Linnemannia schmuckeri TaxID=64567 RepID=A0A9P5S3C3_9FUNG|nr:hypothetical protein BG015_005542 [Linnemannia schmuckeri]